MRLHLGQRQVTFEDLWANVIQFGKDAQGPSWQNESIVVVVCLCVCVEGVFLLTGVWEAKGRYSFEKASAEDHEADHEVMCDWTMTCLEGPQSLNQMTWEQISRGKSILIQAEQGQTGNTITPGGNNKLHLTEASSPLDRDKRSQTEQMAHRVINLLLCICCFSESGKSCPAFSFLLSAAVIHWTVQAGEMCFLSIFVSLSALYKHPVAGSAPPPILM